GTFIVTAGFGTLTTGLGIAGLGTLTVTFGLGTLTVGLGTAIVGRGTFGLGMLGFGTTTTGLGISTAWLAEVDNSASANRATKTPSRGPMEPSKLNNSASASSEAKILFYTRLPSRSSPSWGKAWQPLLSPFFPFQL